MTVLELTQDNKRAHTTKKVRSDARIRTCVKLIKKARPASLLDIGCGDGGFLRNFPEVSRKTGLDVVPRDLDSGMEFVLHDITERFPFPDDSFDALFAGEVLEHVIDTSSFLRECRRVLKPNGTLVLTTPNLCALKNIYFWAVGKQFQYVDYRMGQLGHVRYFSPESIRRIAWENGLIITRLMTNGYNLSDYSRMLKWLEGLTMLIFARFLKGNCLIVSSRKAV